MMIIRSSLVCFAMFSSVFALDAYASPRPHAQDSLLVDSLKSADPLHQSSLNFLFGLTTNERADGISIQSGLNFDYATHGIVLETGLIVRGMTATIPGYYGVYSEGGIPPKSDNILVVSVPLLLHVVSGAYRFYSGLSLDVTVGVDSKDPAPWSEYYNALNGSLWLGFRYDSGTILGDLGLVAPLSNGYNATTSEWNTPLSIHLMIGGRLASW